MKTLVMTRTVSSDHGTFGIIDIDGTIFNTLELPWRDNSKGVSCIPNGVYECYKRFSSKFGQVYEVRDVPDRLGILIHIGNYGGDRSKGLKSDIEGCILIGKSVGIINGQKCILNSRLAMKEFVAKTNGEPFILNIR